MGNCLYGAKAQAAIVEYPSGRHECVVGGRVTAHQVMLRNPGFYVAKNSPPARGGLDSSRHGRTPTLLPADAPLSIGKHYRLVTFEEVFFQFSRANRMEFMRSPKWRSSRKIQLQQQQAHQRKNRLATSNCLSFHPQQPNRSSKASRARRSLQVNNYTFHEAVDRKKSSHSWMQWE